MLVTNIWCPELGYIEDIKSLTLKLSKYQVIRRMTSIALKMKSNDVESCGVGYVFGYDEEDPILGLAVRCVWKSTDHLNFSFSQPPPQPQPQFIIFPQPQP